MRLAPGLRGIVAVIVVAVLAGSCGGTDQETETPASVQEYADLIGAITYQFDEEAAAIAADDYPLDAELIEATGVFGAYERSLDRMENITPPADVAAEHADVTAGLAAMQAEVARYLNKAKLEGGFTFELLNADPEVKAKVDAFFTACDALATRLRDLGAEGVPEACLEGDG